MIQRLSWSVTRMLLQREVFEEDDSEVYAFGFECLIANIWQFVIYFAIGLLLRRLIPMALVVAAVICIKQHIGGWHANTHFLCLFTSTVTVVGILLLCEMVPHQAALIMLAVAMILIFALAPIQHVNNPKTEEEIAGFRKTARLVAFAEAVVCIVLYFSPLQRFAVFIAGGLFLAAVSLLFPSMAVSSESELPL